MLRQAFIAQRHLNRVGTGAAVRTCRPGDEVPEAASWGASWFEQGFVRDATLPADTLPPRGWLLRDGACVVDEELEQLEQIAKADVEQAKESAAEQLPAFLAEQTLEAQAPAPQQEVASPELTLEAPPRQRGAKRRGRY